MVIRSIHLHNVRNHQESDLSFVPDVNILTGGNGSGKTSILEALSLCAMARSFVPVSDQALIRHNEDSCTANVTAEKDLGVPYSVGVTVRHGVRKRITTSTQTSCSPRDIIGAMPIVVLSPDHKSITFGAPAERRSFIDAVMAQSSRRVTELLFEHRRLFKHRNAVLSAMAEGRASEQDLDVWTEQFIIVGAEIVQRRAQFLRDVTPRIRESYSSVSGGMEDIDVRYQPDVMDHAADADVHSAEAVAAAYRTIARTLRSREIARQSTMFGPQKDDVALFINGGLVRVTASQGQHKSLLVALKIAESQILQEYSNERPVVLLDDVFSELDADRCRRVLDHVIAMNMQCFVTTTDGHQVRSVLDSVERQHGRSVSIQMSTVVSGRITATERSSAKEAA
ncbi:MAG: DNA replication and repair protein RecF [Candidatus Kapabacteria bacterium]|nr:DNA replication and repair protein RecF [Candidatus Kapabacteria bacterium]